MAKISIVLLKRLNKKNQKTPVYIMYTHKGEKFLINTMVEVKPEHFDTKSRRIKKTHEGNLKNDNHLIAKCFEKIDGIIRTAHLNYQEPTVGLVKKKYFNRTNDIDKNNILELFEKFYLPYVKTAVRDSTYKQKKVVLAHLTSFANFWKRNLTVQYCISTAFYDDYCQYLFDEKKMVNNTVGSQIRRLKSFLYFLSEKKIIDVEPDLSGFHCFKHEAEAVSLEREELLRIKELDLCENPHLEKYRDILLVGVKVGLRISDLISLKRHHLKYIAGVGNFITINTQKTNESVEIPVHEEVLSILKKYNNSEHRLLPKITDQKFNKYIKEIGQLAGLDALIDRQRIVRNNVITETVQKHQVLSSHIMRRTFITHCVKAGIPIPTIKKFTGHRDTKSFNRYLDLNSKEYKATAIKGIY